MKPALKRAALFVGLALILVACGPARKVQIAQLGDHGADAIGADAELRPVALALGAKVFAENCASCHGADLKGLPAKRTPDLTDDYWLHAGANIDDFIMRASDVERMIRYGIRAEHPKTRRPQGMPAAGQGGTLNDGEMDDLADYIWALNGGHADRPTVLRGREMFLTEGGCFDCHAVDAEGDSIVGAPSLRRPDVWLTGHDRKALRAVIASGLLDNASPAFEGKLAPAEMRATAVYVLNQATARRF